MEVGDIRPLQSVERAATKDQQSGGNAAGSLTVRSRHQFSRVLNEEEDVVYRMVEEETGQIVTQVPSEEVLRVAKRLQQILSDRKAK